MELQDFNTNYLHNNFHTETLGAKRGGPSWRQRRNRRGTGGGGDGEWQLGADLDLPAKVRQLWEAYDAPAEVVARPGWEGRSGGARGQRRRMGWGRGRGGEGEGGGGG